MKKYSWLLVFLLIGCSKSEPLPQEEAPMNIAIVEQEPPETIEPIIPPQYIETKILREGNGDIQYQEGLLPVIRFQIWDEQGALLAHNLEDPKGFVFNKSDFLIPGVKEGMIGMKLGEKREIIVSNQKSLKEDLPLSNGFSLLDAGAPLRAEIEMISIN